MDAGGVDAGDDGRDDVVVAIGRSQRGCLKPSTVCLLVDDVAARLAEAVRLSTRRMPSSSARLAASCSSGRARSARSGRSRTAPSRRSALPVPCALPRGSRGPPSGWSTARRAARSAWLCASSASACVMNPFVRHLLEHEVLTPLGALHVDVGRCATSGRCRRWSRPRRGSGPSPTCRSRAATRPRRRRRLAPGTSGWRRR